MSDKIVAGKSKSDRLAKVWQFVVTWSVTIFGTVGVTILLMFLAGVFSSKVDEEQSASMRPVPQGAQTAIVRVISMPRYETAVGTITPIHQSSIAAKILARVVEVNFSAGQKVSEGDVLLRLDDEDLRSRLQQAEAQLESARAQASNAQQDLRRGEELILGNNISRAVMDEYVTRARTTKAEVDRAQRAVEESRVILSYATVTAPFGGIVVDKKIESGDTVTPGQTLLTLYDPNQMQLVANVRETVAMKLHVGDQVKAKLETLDHECYATIREFVPQADAGSRSFQVKVSGPCPPGIYSGMFGRLYLPLENEEIIVVPATAIRRVGQLSLVDVVAGDHLVRRGVVVGRFLAGSVEILSGLKPGEQVLLQDAQRGADHE